MLTPWFLPLLLSLFSLLACRTPDDGSCIDDSGVVHAADDDWECSDDCDGGCCTYCNCVEGEVYSYMPDCQLDTCSDATGSYELGDTWTCPDGCNTCTCESGGSISATEMSCG